MLDAHTEITEASWLIAMPMGTVKRGGVGGIEMKRGCSRDNCTKDVNRQAKDWGEGEGSWVRLGEA